jgi:CBS domain containing-hemolysin-like protein
MTIVVSVLVLLVGFNALYVAAEFGAVSVRRARVHRLADEGNRLAGRLVPILDDARRLDDYIAACQVGITLSSLVLGCTKR